MMGLCLGVSDSQWEDLIEHDIQYQRYTIVYPYGG